MSYLPSDLQGINSPVMSATTNQWSGDVTIPGRMASSNRQVMTPIHGWVGRTSINGVLPDQKYPVAQQWNLTIGHEFGNGLMLEASYAGSKGRIFPCRAGASASCLLARRDPQPTLPEIVQADLWRTRRRPLHLVPNPFFGQANTGVLGFSPTIMIGQLQRPFPQWASEARIHSEISFRGTQAYP